MSIVQGDLPDAHVLDLFAGSGALGLEALSRGAAAATFVELSGRGIVALRQNVQALDAAARVTIHKGDAIRFVARLEAGAYDVAFADPPYRQGLAEELAARWLESPFATVLGIEHEKSVHLPECEDRRAYGDTVVSFYRTS